MKKRILDLTEKGFKHHEIVHLPIHDPMPELIDAIEHAKSEIGVISTIYFKPITPSRLYTGETTSN